MTGRHTDRQTDIQTDRQRGRQADRDIHIHTYIHTDIQTDIQADRQTDIQTGRQTYIHTYRHTDREAAIQRDRATERQRERTTERHIHTLGTCVAVCFGDRHPSGIGALLNPQQTCMRQGLVCCLPIRAGHIGVCVWATPMMLSAISVRIRRYRPPVWRH